MLHTSTTVHERGRRSSTNLGGTSGIRRDVRPEHDRAIYKLVAASLENKSRDEIAKLMTVALDWKVTRSMLDNFAAGNKVTARFPASFISAFCEACGDDRLRLEVVGERLRRRVEFAERILAAARNRRELRNLVEFMRASLTVGHDRKELRRLLDEILGDERGKT